MARPLTLLDKISALGKVPEYLLNAAQPAGEEEISPAPEDISQPVSIGRPLQRVPGVVLEPVIKTPPKIEPTLESFFSAVPNLTDTDLWETQPIAPETKVYGSSWKQARDISRTREAEPNIFTSTGPSAIVPAPEQPEPGKRTYSRNPVVNLGREINQAVTGLPKLAVAGASGLSDLITGAGEPAVVPGIGRSPRLGTLERAGGAITETGEAALDSMGRTWVDLLSAPAQIKAGQVPAIYEAAKQAPLETFGNLAIPMPVPKAFGTGGVATPLELAGKPITRLGKELSEAGASMKRDAAFMASRPARIGQRLQGSAVKGLGGATELVGETLQTGMAAPHRVLSSWVAPGAPGSLSHDIMLKVAEKADPGHLKNAALWFARPSDIRKVNPILDAAMRKAIEGKPEALLKPIMTPSGETTTPIALIQALSKEPPEVQAAVTKILTAPPERYVSAKTTAVKPIAEKVQALEASLPNQKGWAETGRVISDLEKARRELKAAQSPFWEGMPNPLELAKSDFEHAAEAVPSLSERGWTVTREGGKTTYTPGAGVAKAEVEAVKQYAEPLANAIARTLESLPDWDTAGQKTAENLASYLKTIAKESTETGVKDWGGTKVYEDLAKHLPFDVKARAGIVDTSPVGIVVATLQHLAEENTWKRLLQGIRETYEGKPGSIKLVSDKAKVPAGYKMLPKTSEYGPLAGMVVPIEAEMLLDSVKHARQGLEEASAGKAIDEAMAVWKRTRVNPIMSPPTLIRNVLSAGTSQGLTGGMSIFNPLNDALYAKMLKQWMGTPAKELQEYMAAANLGASFLDELGKPTANIVQFLGGKNRSWGQAIKALKDLSLKDQALFIWDRSNNLYSGVDQFFKSTAYTKLRRMQAAFEKSGTIPREARLVFGKRAEEFLRGGWQKALEYANAVFLDYQDISPYARWTERALSPFYKFKFLTNEQIANWLQDHPLQIMALRAAGDMADRFLAKQAQVSPATRDWFEANMPPYMRGGLTIPRKDGSVTYVPWAGISTASTVYGPSDADYIDPGMGLPQLEPLGNPVVAALLAAPAASSFGREGYVPFQERTIAPAEAPQGQRIRRGFKELVGIAAPNILREPLQSVFGEPTSGKMKPSWLARQAAITPLHLTPEDVSLKAKRDYEASKQAISAFTSQEFNRLYGLLTENPEGLPPDVQLILRKSPDLKLSDLESRYEELTSADDLTPEEEREIRAIEDLVSQIKPDLQPALDRKKEIQLERGQRR